LKESIQNKTLEYLDRAEQIKIFLNNQVNNQSTNKNTPTPNSKNIPSSTNTYPSTTTDKENIQPNININKVDDNVNKNNEEEILNKLEKINTGKNIK